jgi:hypothetical protein
MNIHISLGTINLIFCSRRRPAQLAVEEEAGEWEVIQEPVPEDSPDPAPAPAPVVAPALPPPGFERRPPSLPELEGGDLRFYIVFSIRGETELAGLHWSRGTSAYRALIALNGGNFGGLKWRRHSDYKQALQAYQDEKDRHRLDTALPVQYYYWA